MAGQDKDRSYFLQLLEKYQAGIATPAEKAFIDQYLENVEAHSTESLTDEELACSVADTKRKLLGSIHGEIEQESKSSRVIRMRKYWWAAASILVIAAASWWMISSNKQSEPVAHTLQADLPPGKERAVLILADGSAIALDSAANGNLATQGSSTIMKSGNGRLEYQTGTNNKRADIIYNTVQTPRGGQYQVRLPDGTMVWMNASSSIRFPATFTGLERRVEITGEIYFEVAKNPRKPFIVAASHQAEIEVTGTHFNVNAYADEPAIKTTLLEGSVNVRTPAKQTRKLTPGQQGIVTTGQPAVEVKNGIDIDEVMAWKNGYFQFNRTDLKTVMRQIGRWYDVDIEYEGAVPNDAFIGKMPRRAPASQVLKALEEMEVHLRIEGKKIIVTP